MDRLFKSGLITTIVGLVIILAAVFTWIFKKDVEATEVTIIGSIGSALLFLKDKHIGIRKKV